MFFRCGEKYRFFWFEQIALHSKRSPGKFATKRAHLLDEKISGVERGAQYLLNKAKQIGAHAHSWAQDMLDERGIEGIRVLQGFLSLTRKYKPEQIEQASLIAGKGRGEKKGVRA